MKKIILPVMLFISFMMHGQVNYSIKFGSLFNDNRKDGIFNTLVHSDGKFAYYIRYEEVNKSRYGKVYIEKYGEDLKRQKVIATDFKNEDGKEIYLYKTMFLGGKALIVYGKKSGMYFNIYAISLSLDGEWGKETLLQEKTYDNSNYIITEDATKLICYILNTPQLQRLNLIPLKIFSSDLELITEAVVKIPHEANQIELLDVNFSNEGNMYFLLKKTLARVKGDPIQRYDYKFCAVTNAGKTYKELPLVFDNGNYFHSGKINVWDENHVYLEGYISKKSQLVNGYCHISIDPTSMKYNFVNAGDFSPEFQKVIFDGTQTDKKGETTISLPVIDAIIGKNDGGYTIVRRTSDWYGKPRNIVVVTSIDNRGREEWNSSFPIGFFVNSADLAIPVSFDVKNVYDMQFGNNTLYVQPYKNNIHIFYIEHKDNIKVNDRMSTLEFNYRDANLAMAVIDEKGGVTRKIIHTPNQNTEDAKVFYRLSNFISYQDGEIILDKRSRYTFVPGRFVFK
jgi:hypothetical protein